MKFRVLLFLMAAFLLMSCNQWDTLRVFEKNVQVPGYEWSYNFRPSFTVEITDTAATYNIYVTLRHTEAYPFSNIWLLITTEFPGEKPQTRRVELPLADVTGKWLGSGMDDIYEHRIPIQQNALFNKPGSYHFSFEQNMRQNPLPHVMSVGLRVEKAGTATP